MKLTALVPCYDPEAIGGSHEYVRRLLHGLEARGVEGEVLTTRHPRFRFEGAHSLVWQSGAPSAPEGAAGRPHVRRFRAFNLPGPLRRLWSREIERASRRARRGVQDRLDSVLLGFHDLESNGTCRFRWTSERAAVRVRQRAMTAARFEVHAASDVRLRISVDGRSCADVSVRAGHWTPVEAAFAVCDEVTLSLSVEPPLRAPGDARTLGVAVRRIGVETEGAHVGVGLEEWDSALSDLSTDQLAPRLDAAAGSWGWAAALQDALLKGPVSPGLLGGAVRSARRGDVVLATDAPFLSLLYGIAAGAAARRPVILLPFLHLRDPFHHRRALRAALRRADRVLCLDQSMKRFVESQWGGTGAYVGGGIDVAELTSPEIDGKRFRRAHGLEGVPLVLAVARKTAAKGYEMASAAVQELRRRGRRCHFVLIGPDEDGLPLRGDGILYLGRRPRREVLDALDACDAFVLPSVYESFGLVYLEAWMRGKPVIGHSRCDSARELIESTGGGFLVSELPELVESLSRLLDDAALRAELGRRGRAGVLARHTWDHVADRVRDVIGEVVQEARRS